MRRNERKRLRPTHLVAAPLPLKAHNNEVHRGAARGTPGWGARQSEKY